MATDSNSNSVNQGPVPLSFPSILRNGALTDRFASKKGRRRDDNGGKRWIKRKENTCFVGNPYIISATKKDYILEPPSNKTTFPEPLPSYLPRTAKVPGAHLPTRDPNSANAGRFSLSLKGMRRDLRKAGRRAQLLVQDIEQEVIDWLHVGGTVMSPDTPQTTSTGVRRAIGDTETIFEVSRTPLQLVWCTNNDAFGRYVVHCCARYHEIVSYSEEVDGERLTYLLRPNVIRPDFHAPFTLPTPPVTDNETSSQFDTQSEFTSDVESLNDVATGLSVVPENSPPLSPVADVEQDFDEVWSVLGDSDIKADESGDGHSLSAGLASLTMDQDADITPRPSLPLRTRLRQARSASSPSRSPACKPIRLRRPVRRKAHAPEAPTSFYAYLFP
ncbi:uncharacterized protein BT62DRAFT_1075933 [Guyanagaster necrorhizus]|uniref:Uncharacterized protein n=1 Tax=Guyanagaster necrorhizus TaxID=856835 RepID=A0A9P7VRZ6_9AGAR|nr:uncharacterized protein BT62DRAFT_1075933 [Guyanagaster necrorhizus MCA 3950]KAG7446356.1 hypothetical protein BT62DRAFT_1075933 [Guyanagaster necrorhizus MCA 3950]